MDALSDFGYNVPLKSPLDNIVCDTGIQYIGTALADIYHSTSCMLLSHTLSKSDA
jgi:hypothetical protein